MSEPKPESEIRWALDEHCKLLNTALSMGRGDIAMQCYLRIGVLEWVLSEEKTLPAESRFSYLVSKIKGIRNSAAAGIDVKVPWKV